MKKDTEEITTSSNDEKVVKKEKETKVIHVQIVGGTPADIFEIGNAMSKFKASLPYKLEAIVTNENVILQDVDVLIKELYKLKKSIDIGKRLGAD